MESKPTTEIEKQIKLEQLKEAQAHQATLLDIQQVLSTKAGKNFVKYLFKELSVAEAIPMGLLPELFREYVGHQRAGAEVFNIVAEADPIMAGSLLGLIQKEKYVQNALEARYS